MAGLNDTVSGTAPEYEQKRVWAESQVKNTATAQIAQNQIARGLVGGYPPGHGTLYPRETSIIIHDAENGRIIRLNNKIYICPQGTPLLDILGQALVEAQLEK